MVHLATLADHQGDPIEQHLIVGFFDLTLYMKWAALQKPTVVFKRLDEFFVMTAGSINSNGGLFIKAIGDAGLFIFPGGTAQEVDHAIATMQRLQALADSWLQSKPMESRVIVQMNVGLVACGQIGSTDDKRFDIYGDTVNQTALLPVKKFAISAALYDQSSAETQFKFQLNQQGGWELNP